MLQIYTFYHGRQDHNRGHDYSDDHGGGFLHLRLLRTGGLFDGSAVQSRLLLPLGPDAVDADRAGPVPCRLLLRSKVVLAQVVRVRD